MTINLSNVLFHYPERRTSPILNVPSWSVSAGEKVLLHGPSGSGKSTLLNLLSGLLPPTKGQISILGQRLDQINGRQRDRFRAEYIGYVFQQFNLIPYLNAIDNIRLACQFVQKKNSIMNNDIEALLVQLNISDDIWQSPARDLSIGQQQRVAIARALINKPKLLIADEPTSALDEGNRDLFMSFMMKMIDENDITLIFVSHDMSLSHYFSRIEPLSAINQLEATR